VIKTKEEWNENCQSDDFVLLISRYWMGIPKKVIEHNEKHVWQWDFGQEWRQICLERELDPDDSG
jgi:hypothetical protein